MRLPNADNDLYRLGSSANFLSTMLTSNGVPNDVIGNFNSLSIILVGPILNVSVSTPAQLNGFIMASFPQYPKPVIFTRYQNWLTISAHSFSMDCTPCCVTSRSITVPLLALPPASSSPLVVALGTPFCVTRHTRPALAAGTAPAMKGVSSMAWFRRYLCGGRLSHTPWAACRSCLSMCQVCQPSTATLLSAMA